MRKILLALATAAAGLAPATAHAVVIFNVNGVFAGGGTLTGTFTTNDALTSVLGIDLLASASGAFTQSHYNSVGAVDSQLLPNSFRLTVFSPTKQLQIAFSPPLNAAGGTIGPNSFEAQQIIGAGNRILSGTVSAAAANGAVPEPATWVMAILGFGMVGGAMRHRTRRSVTYRFA